MTREEIETKMYAALEYDGVYDLEDIINSMLDDIESRTCENCKYSTLLDTDDLACESEYMIAEFNTYPQYPLIVDGDFGCNKFERKDK